VQAAQCSDGRLRVLPGQPSESYLMDKLMGTQLCAGKKMVLPEADIETIAAWICAGAPDN
jgi:hypothetical protein